MTRLSPLAALLIALAPMAAQAEGPQMPATSLAQLVDQAEIIRITNAIDIAVDRKDWETARGYFAETIHVDFTSLVGGDPATIPADALIAGWAGNLTAEKESFHLRGNHQVSFPSADTATVYSHGYAWNRMERGLEAENGGEALWEVWGSYTHDLRRGARGWEVTGMSFTATAERGSSFVRNTPGS